jgi:hypothetical protein
MPEGCKENEPKERAPKPLSRHRRDTRSLYSLGEYFSKWTGAAETAAVGGIRPFPLCSVHFFSTRRQDKQE